MITNTLGKIIGVSFGQPSEYPFLCGLEVELEAGGRRRRFFSRYVNLDCAPMEESNALLHWIKTLLDKAKVQDITGLVGKPVEVSFTETSRCVGFRILTEVL